MRADRLLVPLGALALAGGSLAAAWVMLRPAPVRDLRAAVARAASAGRLDEAEELLRDRLDRDPGDDLARFLLAELMLERPDQPEDDEAYREVAARALGHLDDVSFDDPAQAARAALYRAKASYRLDRWAAMERAAREALRLDPTVPEAGWILLELYYVQGRARDAHDLALRLHEVEPDPRDRVQLLVELIRQDAQPPDATSIVDLLEPVVAADPGDVASASAFGLALVQSGEPERGLEQLRASVERHPGDPGAWAGLFRGLEEANRLDALASNLGKLPGDLADDPRFARYRGRVAQQEGDWEAAAGAYRRAFGADPIDPSLAFNLGHSLKNAGRPEEGEPYIRAYSTYSEARDEVRPLYEELDATETLGVAPHPGLEQRAGDLRRRMLRPEEARAWYRLVLEDRPGDPAARAALRELDEPPPGG